MYRLLLFDLDGTLTDSGEGITNSVAYALRHYGIEVPSRSELYRFIGPPLAESFSRYYGFSEAEAARAVECYREYFADRGIYENRVYDGTIPMLQALKEAGKTLIIASSKPTVYVKRILHHFALDVYFSDAVGSNLDGTRVKKEEVIACALAPYRTIPRAEILMVGDRAHDILGAKKCGIAACGVLYGYGSADELRSAGAAALASSPAALTKLILQER